MTLNGVIARILSYFRNSIALQADYVTVIEDRPIMSAKYRLPVTFGQNWPTQQSHDLFATAKLLVIIYSYFPYEQLCRSIARNACKRADNERAAYMRRFIACTYYRVYPHTVSRCKRRTGLLANTAFLCRYRW